LLPTLQAEGLAISLITYGEVYDGIYYGRDPGAAERAFLRFLRGATVLPLNRSIVRQFALLRGDLRRRGLGIGDLDTLIAATALHHDLTLVTRNVRHYTRIAGLRILQPT
jgi:tRNA(fMet)-specific endonuclease VapC